MAVQHDDDESTTFGNTPKQDDYESVNLLKEDYDDDESTILDLQPKRIPQQETPSAASNTSSQVSPTTQTLNALSQNMDDLRYNSNTNTNNNTIEQRQVKAAKAKKKNNGSKDPTERKQVRHLWIFATFIVASILILSPLFFRSTIVDCIESKSIAVE